MVGVECFSFDISHGREDTCWLLMLNLYRLLLFALRVAKIAWTVIGCLETLVALFVRFGGRGPILKPYLILLLHFTLWFHMDERIH